MYIYVCTYYSTYILTECMYVWYVHDCKRMPSYMYCITYVHTYAPYMYAFSYCMYEFIYVSYSVRMYVVCDMFCKYVLHSNVHTVHVRISLICPSHSLGHLSSIVCIVYIFVLYFTLVHAYCRCSWSSVTEKPPKKVCTVHTHVYLFAFLYVRKYVDTYVLL